MNEAENNTAIPAEAVGTPAPEPKPAEETNPTQIVENKPKVNPDESEKQKAVKEAFIRGRIERRKNKDLQAEIDQLKQRLEKGNGKPADDDDDGNDIGAKDLRREIDELKGQIKELSKASRNSEVEKRRVELEKQADMLMLNDHDIKGVEDMAAVEALVDPVLYARRPDLAVQAAIAEWKESNGISVQAQAVATAAKGAAPSSRANAGGSAEGVNKGSILAQINSLDPSKPGAKAELEKLLKKLHTQT